MCRQIAGIVQFGNGAETFVPPFVHLSFQIGDFLGSIVPLRLRGGCVGFVFDIVGRFGRGFVGLRV